MSLSLFAQAVAARPVPVEVTTRSGPGHTDGETIFLPEALDLDSVEARRLVMTQAALLSTDALAGSHLRRLRRSGTTALQRYLTLEVVRACAVFRGRLPRRAAAEVLAVLGDAPVSTSAEESLRRALSDEDLRCPPTWFGELVPAVVVRGAGRPDHGAQDQDAATSSAFGTAADEGSEADDGDDADEDSGHAAPTSELTSPLKFSLGDSLRKLLGRKRSSGASGAEIAVAGGRLAPGSSAKGRLVPGAAPQRIEMGGHLVVGATYPEWDCAKGVYLEDFTTVGEFDPAHDETVRAAGAQGDRLLMRKLAQLGLSWQTRAGEQSGDSVDLTALIDLRTRVAAGEGGEAAIYTAHRRTAQRLGVLILLDATGSTAGSAEGSQVFAQQRELVYQMTSAFEQLGVRTATYAFYSRGRRNVRFLHIKAFDEQWDSAAQRRMMSVQPSGFTRLGAAVRHATHVIATRAGTEHQLVVVVGDGVVYDDGYEDRHAAEDSRRAIEEAAARGVALVGLSVQPIPDASVWPDDHAKVVSSTTELAGVVKELFGGALQRSRGARRPTTPTRSQHVGAA